MKKMFSCAALALLLVCFATGAVAECAHKNLGSSWLSSKVNRSGYIVNHENPSTHYYTHDLVNVAYCRDCKEDVVIGEPFKTGVRVEEVHDFDTERNVCEDCGYPNYCAHANTYNVVRNDPANKFRTYVDEQHHSVLYNQLIKEYCKNCGTLVVNDEIVRHAGNMLEMHEFDDENKCRCGYEKPDCAHAHTYVRYYDHDKYSGYENVDFSPMRHAYESRIFEEIYCEDCGEKVEDRQVSTEMILQNHNRDEDECTVCGYNSLDCAHTYTIQNESFRIASRRTEYIDEKTHRVYGQLAQSEVCISCDFCVGDQLIIDSAYSEVQIHEWQGNVCEYCGYVSQCKHPRTETEYTYTDLRDANVKNGTEHWVYADKMETTCCKDCGYVLDSRLKETDVVFTREHEFTSGICWLCEYVKGDPYPEMIRQVGTQIGDFKEEPSKEPLVLDLNGALPLGARVVVEESKAIDANTELLEIELKDINYNAIQPDGRVTLFIPYPDGLDISSQNEWDFVIKHHPGEPNEQTFRTSDGSAEFWPQGIAIKVRSFSPFTREKVVAEDTERAGSQPATGDNSHLLAYAALLCAALAGCAAVAKKRRDA